MKLQSTLFYAVLSGAAFGQQTPPVQPNVTQVPVPPALTLPGPTTTVIPKAITASDAAQIAVKNQPDITLAQAQVLAAEGRYIETRSNLLPQGNANAGYTRFQQFRGSGSGGSSTGFDSSITLSQLLFDFNHTVDTVRQAAALSSAAKQDLTTAQANAVYNVKQAYYTYQQDEQLIKVEEANVSNTGSQLQFAAARLTAGLGAPADVLQAATDLGSATQDLVQARQTALLSQVSLALVMGIDPRTPITLADSQEPAPDSDDVTALVTSALARRPEIRAAKDSLRAAGFGLSAAKTTSAPSIGVSASVGSRGPNDPFGSQNGSVGLSLNWNFLDGGFSAGATKVARGDVLTAQANLKQASLNAVSDVSQAYINLKAADQSVSVGQAQVANATESVRLAEGRFKAGVATFLEVTTAQSQLVQAQVSLVNAQTLVQVARAQLEHAVGAPVSAELRAAPASRQKPGR